MVDFLISIVLTNADIEPKYLQKMMCAARLITLDILPSNSIDSSCSNSKIIKTISFSLGIYIMVSRYKWYTTICVYGK